MTNVVITGGLGSLGNQLLDRYNKKWDIIVLDNDECRQWEVRNKYPDVNYVLGDIRDADSLKPIKNADLVIHAAALKRIEVCEANPWEAVKTNIRGTKNVINACQKYGTDMVYISTDKAVEPINFYGMTKAIAERMSINAGFNCVRYGNVFGSRGSIAPIFAEQMKKGEKITVTHKDMTRFILTLDEALDLIEEASKSEHVGAIYVKKCPSCKVTDIASYFGEIRIIGAKIGEKLHETLITSDEMRRTISGADYFIITNDIMQDYLPAFTSENAEIISRRRLDKLVEPWLM